MIVSLLFALLNVVFISPAYCSLENEVREIQEKLVNSEQNGKNLSRDIKILQRSIDTLLGHRQTIEDNQAEIKKELRELRENSGRIGEIRYSILTLEEFQKLYGTSWVLMDGRSVINTALETVGISRIPDARGVFLRGKNHGVPITRGNPDGDLEIGRYQKDKFAEHTHASVGKPDTENTKNSWCRGPSWTTNDLKEIPQADKASIQFRTGPAGNSETRPKCITVNVFIKIHDARDLPTQDHPGDAQTATGNAGDGDEHS